MHRTPTMMTLSPTRPTLAMSTPAQRDVMPTPDSGGRRGDRSLTLTPNPGPNPHPHSSPSPSPRPNPIPNPTTNRNIGDGVTRQTLARANGLAADEARLGFAAAADAGAMRALTLPLTLALTLRCTRHHRRANHSREPSPSTSPNPAPDADLFPDCKRRHDATAYGCQRREATTAAKRRATRLGLG